MADNFIANPGSGGDTFAADDIGGTKFPRSKITIGADGSNDGDVSASNPLPVTVSGGATAAKQDTGNTSLASIDGKLPALFTTIPNNDTSAPPSRLVGEDIWNCSFSDVGASVLASEFTLRKAGTGVGYSQAAGALAVTAGTTANSEFLARSVRSWQGSLQLRYSTVLSQRIVNNNFAVLLCDLIGEGLSVTINSTTSISVTMTAHGYTAVNVGQFMLIGNITGAAGVPGRFAIASIPDANTINFTVAGWPASGSCTVDVFGHSYVRCLYTSTTATNVAFDTQRKGWANGDTTATCLTTASPGHIAQVHCDGRNAYLANSLRASTTTPNMTMCSNKIESLPDDNLSLYVYLWSYNGTTNPASGTTWTISFCSLEKYANLPVYVQGQRMQGAAAAGPVSVVGTAAVSLATNTPTLAAGTNLAGDVGQQYRANATGAASGTHLISAASTNATVVKASAGRVVGWCLGNNAAAAVYVKFHNQATTPTAGSGVVRSIRLPAGGTVTMNLEGGIAFTTGIAITTVTGAADADTTAVAANDIVGDIFFA